MHFMLARIIDQPCIELDEEDSKTLAKAVARVQKEFGVTILSPKAAAVVNLCMVGGGIYGPRLVTIVNEAKKKKKAKAAGADGPGPIIEGVGQVM
jgi:hypothetical protein